MKIINRVLLILNMSRTLRFNVSQKMTDILLEFHTKNKDLGKNEYKKQWDQFILDNSDTIAKEEKTLLKKCLQVFDIILVRKRMIKLTQKNDAHTYTLTKKSLRQ